MTGMTDSCPEEIKKTLVRLAKDVCLQKWAKKREIRELGEEVRFAVDRGHKNKLYDMNRAESKRCKCCQLEGPEKHRLYHRKEWKEERNKMPDVVRSCGM